MKTEFCPQCVIDFVNEMGVECLDDEIQILHDPSHKSDIKFELCEDHRGFNLFTSLRQARELTRAS